MLYLNDGQNLFEAALSLSGQSWCAAEAAAQAMAAGEVPPFIVVGIDHAGASRSYDYCPYKPGVAHRLNMCRPSGVATWRQTVSCLKCRKYRVLAVLFLLHPWVRVGSWAELFTGAVFSARCPTGTGPGGVRADAADWPGGDVDKYLQRVVNEIMPFVCEVRLATALAAHMHMPPMDCMCLSMCRDFQATQMLTQRD